MTVGSFEGAKVDLSVGTCVGNSIRWVGFSVGFLVGMIEGSFVGVLVGLCVGSCVCDNVDGRCVGFKVGNCEGFPIFVLLHFIVY